MREYERTLVILQLLWMLADGRVLGIVGETRE